MSPSGARPGAKAPRWKGDAATGKSIHDWLNKTFPRSGTCEGCGANPGLGRTGTGYAFLRHPSLYTREISDYRELCRRCHHLLDEPHAKRGERLRRQKALK